MAENDPTSPPAAHAPSSDLQLAPESINGAMAVASPDGGLPARSLVQQPRWPHPSFGWALLWCLLLWIVTQVPGAVITIVIAMILHLVAPEQFPLDMSKTAELYKSDAMSVGLAIGQFVTEILVVGFSWLVIRLVVGRDWTRQLAVRRPGLAHTLLVTASFPILALLGNVTYELLRASHRVPSISDANPLNLVYFWTAVFVVLGAALLAAWLLAGFRWTRRLAARPVRPADLLVVAAVLPALLLCILVVYEGLRGVFPVPSLGTVKLGGMEEMVKIFDKWPLGFAVLVIGLGPGIGEELWCRGFLGRGLVGSHGAVLGVLASSFLFGLIHGDPCQGTMAMVMGLWLHFIYLTTRSLLLPMLLHFLNNSFSVLASRIPSLELLDSKPQDIPLSVYVTGLLLLGGVAYALYQSRARLAAATPEQLLVWRPAFEGVEYPPDGSGARVIHPPLSLPSLALAGGGFVLFVLACVAWAQ